MKVLSATMILVLATGGLAHDAAAAGISASDGVQQVQEVPTSEVLRDYAGTYPLAQGFELAIRERDGTLYVQAPGQPEFPLTHVEHDRFANPTLGLEIDFERDADGSVTTLELRQAGQVLRGERQ